jgi:hypothetical protein
MNTADDKVNELKLAQDEYVNQMITNEQQIIRDQKRSIVQSSIDRTLYHRAGDDPCTSGVSMTSSEIRRDHESVPDKNENHPQSSSSVVNDLAKHPDFVWYAAYDWEMRDEVFNDMIYECSNNTPPLNKVSIKLENFDIVFAKVENANGMVYLQQRTCGSWFVKLYLIHKDQLLDLTINKSKAFWPDYSDFSMLSSSLLHNSESVIIDHSLPYGYLLRIGDYDNFSIYTLTNSRIQVLQDIKNQWEPSDFYIKELFKAMTDSFPNFSSDFLLYYINSKKGLKNKLTSKLMTELRQFGTLINETYHYNTNQDHEIESQGAQKLLCDEELEERDNHQVRSDLTKKYTRKVNYGCWPPNVPSFYKEKGIGFVTFVNSSRNNSQVGTTSLKSSGYQHSLVRNKNLESGFKSTLSVNHTSLGNVPELSFTRSDAEVDYFKKYKDEKEEKRQMSDQKQNEKIFIVNRNFQTSIDQTESNLFCNEDLDANLLSQLDKNEYYERNQNFEKWYKSEVSSIMRAEEDFEEFMRWGNKFASDSKNNLLQGAARVSNENSSFTFTKKDEKSPQKDLSRSHTEESKIEQLEIEECSPNELPSVKIPKRFVSSGAGEIFEKHLLDRIHGIEKTKSSRNSTWFPESQSHKASIIRPKLSRDDSKKSPMLKPKKKAYSYKSNFQCGGSDNRSRNPFRTGGYFTTGSKPLSGEKLHQNTRTNDSKMSKGSDGFREIEMFTFAKQSPKINNNKSGYKKSPLKTPTTFKKLNGKEKNSADQK